MVSKLSLRTSPKPKPPKPSPALTVHPIHRKKNRLSSPTSSPSSPLKSLASAPSAVAAAVDRSLRSCRRRLIKLFAHLTGTTTTATTITPAPTTTPKPRRSNKKRSLRRLLLGPSLKQASTHPPAAPAVKPLPPPSDPSKPTLFLDLDETLVHSTTAAADAPPPPPGTYDFSVHPSIDGQTLTFYVLKRPGVDEFLAEVARSFEVVVFTAGLREYASLVVNRLDPAGSLVSHRLYRDSCREMDGRLVKDLSVVGRDLRRVMIVDDNPHSYVFQPENAVPVGPFVDDPSDQELDGLRNFFEGAALFDDTRDAVKYYLAMGLGRARNAAAKEEHLDITFTSTKRGGKVQPRAVVPV